jgi:hypothetical protein
MKKLILLILIVVTTQLSFANDAPATTSSVVKTFNRNFYTATDVQWQHSEAYEKASFLLNNQFMDAYYTPGGELLAVIRNITSDQLPLKLLLDLKKNYSALWISELIEVVNGSNDEYYITLENGDEKLTLKSRANKGWKLYQKIVKL